MRSVNFLAIFAVILLFACVSRENMNARIENSVTLHDIPSASGIEFLDGKYWLIGDNSPWLFGVNDAFEVAEKHSIFSMDFIENGTIRKSKKHDFEAMTALNWEGDSALFIFGSGSKTNRFQGVLVKMNNAVHPSIATQKFDLTDFYSKILEKAKLKDGELNIEAAAVLGDHLFLFNRGKNKLISLKVKHFIDYLSGTRETIKIKVKTIKFIERNYSLDEKNYRSNLSLNGFRFGGDLALRSFSVRNDFRRRMDTCRSLCTNNLSMDLS